jgi:hypothetical protein
LAARRRQTIDPIEGVPISIVLDERGHRPTVTTDLNERAGFARVGSDVHGPQAEVAALIENFDPAASH